MPRPLAALVSILLLLGLISGTIFVLSYQSSSFFNDLPQLKLKVINNIDDLQFYLAKEYEVNATAQAGYLSKLSNELLSTLPKSVQFIFMSVSSMLLWTLFTLIFCYFLLTQRSHYSLFITRFFPIEKRTSVNNVMLQGKNLIQQYIAGLLTEMAIVVLVNTLALGILGNKYAIFIGIIVALLNVIPYLGIIVGLLLAFIISFSQYDLQFSFYTILLLYIIHVIEANLLMPKIVGERVELNPFITIIVVLFGGMIWGVSGMFLSIPASAIIKVIFNSMPQFKHIADVMGPPVPFTKKRKKGNLSKEENKDLPI